MIGVKYDSYDFIHMSLDLSTMNKKRAKSCWPTRCMHIYGDGEDIRPTLDPVQIQNVGNLETVW